MFENFKNLFNSQNNQGEELFPFEDIENEMINPELFENEPILISGTVNVQYNAKS